MGKNNNCIENMQAKLKTFRNWFGISVNEFAEELGVTRQTIYNLEHNRTKLTKTQYLALCTVINGLQEQNPAKREGVKVIWEYDFPIEEKTPLCF